MVVTLGFKSSWTSDLCVRKLPDRPRARTSALSCQTQNRLRCFALLSLSSSALVLQRENLINEFGVVERMGSGRGCEWLASLYAFAHDLARFFCISRCEHNRRGLLTPFTPQLMHMRLKLPQRHAGFCCGVSNTVHTLTSHCHTPTAFESSGVRARMDSTIGAEVGSVRGNYSVMTACSCI